MITFSKLGYHGQLGNQMFQVAMLIGVSAKLGYTVKIPKALDKRKKCGLYELNKLNVTLGNLLDSDRRRIRHRYTEGGFAFEPEVFEQEDNTDYVGYFQTHKYFEHCEEEVKKQFTFRNDIDKFAKDYVASNKNEPYACGIHVRRGDYLCAPNYFQVLSPDYYKRAMDHEALPSGRQYFIVSDDIEWCQDNMPIKNAIYVKSRSHWQDLAILTYCDCHILSASSFSWWGAWLSHTKGNTVIYPRPWFPVPGPRGHYDFKDVCPDHWIPQAVQ